jgi:hypothetical protein
MRFPKKRYENEGIETWGEFADYILDKLFREIDYWAHYVDDIPLNTYTTHNNMDLYEAIMLWKDKFDSKDIALFEKIPNKIYEKMNEQYHKELERVISELEKDYKNFCLNECKDKGTDKCKMCEFHYLIE